jgi:pimeloyl-ACP methyl ester carboxylesterase
VVAVVYVLGSIALVILLLAVLLHIYVVLSYIPHAVRIFQDKPLFIPPAGNPVDYAEAVSFPTGNGLTLRGCYLPAQGQRRGVIVFGLEFGSNRWSCVPYCEFLREQGYDIFAFEFRGQGESDPQPGYEPLQWVTDFEVEDFRAALAYVKTRPDADATGVGFFGISKGASAGLIAAAADPYVRCFVTDGAFASHTTMVPYMQKWILIYCRSVTIAKRVPLWYFRRAAHMALDRIEKERGCYFPHLEDVIDRLAPRPLLMIHGRGDNYIKPDMARALFARAREPKEFWLVEGAKHNQAFHVAHDEYKHRVLAFFDEHLAGGVRPQPAYGPPKGLAAKDRQLVRKPIGVLPSAKPLLGILLGLGVGALLGVFLVLWLIADI